MKKCLILLAMLIATLILSSITESENVKMPENIIAINNTEAEYSALKE